MGVPNRPALLRYGVAVAALIATICAGSVLGPESGALFFFAIVVSAWFGGLGPGLLSVAALTLLLVAIPLAEGKPIPSARYLGISLIALLGVVVTVLVEALHRFRRRAEQNAEALRQADRRKDDFLAMLAHELRNPLAAIACAVELQQGSAQSDDRQWTDEVISRQSRHLARLIDDLLDVSRITRGKIQLRKEPVEINTIVQETVSTACPLIVERNHAVVVSLAATPVYVRADPVRVQQILVNLLNNAAKYTEAGGRIEVQVRHHRAEVTISVRDNGVGIAPDQLPRMFALFEQADRSLARSEGGLGIGLTLVRSLVELHGGTVSASSEGLGKGSTFTVCLPALSVAPVPSPSVEPFTQPPRDGTRELRILVVDDNVDTARGLSLLLRRSGHEVEMRHNGPAALEAAAALHPQVVLLDIGLPVMNGFEVAERLRTEADRADLTIIAVSGYGKDQIDSEAATARASSFDFYLVKPIVYDELLALLSVIGQAPRKAGEPVS
jgi:signal transduction histidine kinase/CheY-like chemotaxis protein